MVTLNRIYTKTGDDGTTGLASGGRIPKTSPRIEAIGAVDELNASLGMARATSLAADIEAELSRIQNDLFDLGADLASPELIPGDDGQDMALRLLPGQAERLEQAIDALTAVMPPLKSFILPAGSPSAAALHLARAIARRAERRLWAIVAEDHPHQPQHLTTYLNRLSDYLFVAARKAARDAGGEVTWVPGANR